MSKNNSNKNYHVIKFIKSLLYKKIPLHQPRFIGMKKYLNECIDNSFVSSAGKFVDKFEEEIANYVGVKYAIASSGTSALHLSLILADVIKI